MDNQQHHCPHIHANYQELQDKEYFQRVKVRHGTVVWPHEQDICPDTLYVKSQKIPTVKYSDQVCMTHYRRVEFELPQHVDRQTLEMQAQREASQQYGEADKIEVLTVEEA